MNLLAIFIAVSLAGQLSNPAGTPPKRFGDTAPFRAKAPLRPAEPILTEEEPAPAPAGSSPARAPRVPPPVRQPAAPAVDPAAVSKREQERSVAVLKDSVALPSNAAGKTRAVTLLETLADVSQLRQRVDRTHAYWNTVAAVGQLRFSLLEAEQLQSITVKAGSSRAAVAALEAQRANAAATVQEARVALVGAQHDLAERLGWPVSADLPMPTDLPHVNSYDTHFEELFTGRTAPLGLRMLALALPLRQKAIAARAAAVIAADDAMEAALATDINVLLGCQSELSKQRRAFIAAVRAYNHDIAVYALNAAGTDVAGADLVGMLIKIPAAQLPVNSVPSAAVDSPDGSRVERAGFDATFEVDTPDANGDGTYRGPRFASPDDDAAGSTPDGDVDTDANGDAIWRSSNRGAWRTLPRTLNGNAFQLTSYFQPIAEPKQANTRMLAALDGLSAARRAQELVRALHAGAITATAGNATTLTQCLSAISDIDRSPLIAAYWRARECAAQVAVLQQYVAELDALSAETVDQRDRPGMVDAMLRLKARQLGAEADLADAQVAQMNAEQRLTQMVRKGEAENLLQPTTTPHAGRYLMKLSAQPASVQQSPLVRKLARTVPTLQAAVDDRATAVVAADAAHAQVAAEFMAGTGTLDSALRAGQRQYEATQGFLNSVTQYNLEIARYVLAVLPPETPAATIGGALSLAKANR